MRIALLSSRLTDLEAFRSAWEIRGFRVEAFQSEGGFLHHLRPSRFFLAILDGWRPTFVEALLGVDAALNTVVLTDLDAVAFQKASEGFGVLTSIPLQPGPGDVEFLLECLRKVGALDPTVESAMAHLERARKQHHPACVVCAPSHPFGLKMDYRVTGEHSVEGAFNCGKFYEGYENVLHGGIVSSLLDGAMAACILAKGLEAYTVDLRVRFRSAVNIGIPAMVRGEWRRNEGPLHLLYASLEQEGRIRASARAKFFEGSPHHPDQALPKGAALRGILAQGRKRI